MPVSAPTHAPPAKARSPATSVPQRRGPRVTGGPQRWCPMGHHEPHTDLRRKSPAERDLRCGDRRGTHRVAAVRRAAVGRRRSRSTAGAGVQPVRGGPGGRRGPAASASSRRVHGRSYGVAARGRLALAAVLACGHGAVLSAPVGRRSSGSCGRRSRPGIDVTATRRRIAPQGIDLHETCRLTETEVTSVRPSSRDDRLADPCRPGGGAAVGGTWSAPSSARRRSSCSTCPRS